MSFWPFFLAVLPFAVFVALLFWTKLKLVWISCISFIISGGAAVIFWKIKPLLLLGSLEKGLFVAFDIFLIIVGAIFFLEILKSEKIIENIGFYLRSISGDIRIQVILLAWFFGNFIEGTAGFGTPATVVVPLLMGLGLTPITAVVISLFGNSASGVFGAAGAPIKIGFVELAGNTLPLKASLYNLVGILVPVFMLLFLVSGKSDARKRFFEMLPFALWSGIVFSVSSVLFTVLGPEFPTILGSVLGLFIVLITIKLGIFVPKNSLNFQFSDKKFSKMPFGKVIFPYAILIILLISGKLFLGSKGIAIPSSVKHTFSFFNPGFALFAAGIITSVVFKISPKVFSGSLKSAVKKSAAPFLVIAFMSSMAQIMVNSGQNGSGIESMINSLALGVKNTFLPLLAPFVGAFGSFLTGSVTVSNVMFGGLLAAIAESLNFNTDSILALTLVGGAAGNMIALADVLVTETVAGIKNKEKEIIKSIIIPCLIYVLATGLIGMVAVW